MHKLASLALCAIALLTACGSSAKPLVERSSAEPAGANCPYGGTRHDVGADENGDGMLSDNEVEITFYDCDPAPPLATVHFGNVALASAADVTAATAYTEIVGDLILLSPPGAVTLPNLLSVTGTIHDDDCTGTETMTSLSLPLLTSADGVSLACAGPLASISMPLLTSVGFGGISLGGDHLTQIDFGALVNDDGPLTVSGTLLTSLSGLGALNALRGNDSLTITGNASLDECSLAPIHAQLLASGYRGGVSVSGNLPCADLTKTCVPITVNGDGSSWRECWTRETWRNAQADCTSFGTGWGLLYLTSEAERASLTSSILANGNSYWTGYTDGDVPGAWVWDLNETGTAWLPQGGPDLWAPGEPGTSGCMEIGMDQDMRGTATNCPAPVSVACRRAATPGRLFENFEGVTSEWTAVPNPTAEIDTVPAAMGGGKALHLTMIDSGGGAPSMMYRVVKIPPWATAIQGKAGWVSAPSLFVMTFGPAAYTEPDWGVGCSGPAWKACIDPSLAGTATTLALVVASAGELYLDNLEFTADATGCAPMTYAP